MKRTPSPHEQALCPAPDDTAQDSARRGMCPAPDVSYWEHVVAQETSVAELLHELGVGSRNLIQQEMQLLRREVHDAATETRRGLTWLIVAILPALMALVVLPLALVYGLGTAVPMWVAALSVALVLLVASAVLAFVGVSRMRRVAPRARATRDGAKEDLEWMRDRLS